MTDNEKAEAYAVYFLGKFRDNQKKCEERLALANKRLEIAERQYQERAMVTGLDGNPSIFEIVRQRP